jgi:hypothetical protein
MPRWLGNVACRISKCDKSVGGSLFCDDNYVGARTKVANEGVPFVRMAKKLKILIFTHDPIRILSMEANTLSGFIQIK